MCTVSWVHEADGFWLFSNRDEKLTRPAALAPLVRDVEGVRVLAPVDAAFGGSWIAVNEFGIAACLLNGANVSGAAYSAGPGIVSRGTIALAAAAGRSQEEAIERVANHDLSPFAPFTLVVIEACRHAAIIEWTGEHAAVLPYGEPFRPLASSSFDGSTVRRARRDQFGQLSLGAQTVTPELLSRFHTSHDGGPSAYSPCMHRDDAKTVSFTSVHVAGDGITMRYQPSAPCERRPVQETTLCCSFA